MNNNFHNQNWSTNYQSQQNWSNNKYQNNSDYRNNGTNYYNNRPRLGFQNNRLPHHSNMNNYNNYNNRNDSQFNTNYNKSNRNYHNSYNNNNRANNPSGNQFQNQFNNYSKNNNNFDSKRSFECQSRNNRELSSTNSNQHTNFSNTNFNNPYIENEDSSSHVLKIKHDADDKIKCDVKNSGSESRTYAVNHVNFEKVLDHPLKNSNNITSTENFVNRVNIKKEIDKSQDLKHESLKSDISESLVKSSTVQVKTEKKFVKSEPISTSDDSDHENDVQDSKPSRPTRASKRTKLPVKSVIIDSEEDEEEVDVKPVRKTRKRKLDSSDDEYVPEAVSISPVKPKISRDRKTVATKNVKLDPDEIKNEATVKLEHFETSHKKEALVKTKAVRKPRVTKKMKMEENTADASSTIDTTDTEKSVAKRAKAAPKKTPKKTLSKPRKRIVKTEDSLLTNDDETLNCQEERPAKKKVATKRKLQASTQEDAAGPSGETVGKKPSKQIKPNETYWTDEKLLAEMCQCDNYVAWNFIKLINSDNTIPFIARYRKEMVQNFEAEKLREMKQAYDNIVEIHHKAEIIIGKIEKLKKLTPELKKSIACCKSLEELDLIYSPFKTGSKGTKAEKAKKLGLEAPALAILNGDFQEDLRDFVDASKADLNNLSKVKEGIQFIIADILAKDTAVLETLQELVKSTKVLFESSKTKSAETIENYDKYETYFSYSCDIKFVKPHAVLAINRGESHKVLSVNVKLNDWLQRKLFEFCKHKWLSQGSYSPERVHLFQLSFEDSFKRLIKPFIVRSIRTQLNQTAEIASIQVFASNLKQLLLVPPMHGAVIMAVDPGYSHGCKVAVIDVNGDVLVTDTMYIKFNKAASGGKNRDSSTGRDINALKLRDMVLRYRCELVAIGNGTACRETENYMSELIQNNWFEPLNVCYTIISEQGASIYSCSAEAKKEFPDLDPNVVSAISLARRLQDPLSELVKIEPKHLGVGMYQHDVPEKQLSSTLNEVVSECVSFVGVDINCASQAMLRRLAGLTDATAGNIVKHRSQHGPFQCREELRKVKGIGEKRFEQCAGFVRVSCTEENKGKHNPLDSTWIHPESYEIARKFARNARVDLADLGKDRFIAVVNSYIGGRSPEGWAEEYATSATTMGLIIEAFRLPRDFDLRSKLSKPLFKKGIQSLDDIANGTVLTGKVNNVTHFGCFVDIGLERDALIHISKLRTQVLKLNDKVNVRVIDVDMTRKRVGLELIELIA